MPDSTFEINLDVQRFNQDDIKIEFEENSIVVTTRKVKNLETNHAAKKSLICNKNFYRSKKETIRLLQENSPNAHIP